MLVKGDPSLIYCVNDEESYMVLVCQTKQVMYNLDYIVKTKWKFYGMC